MTIYDQSARLVSEAALATTLADYATSSALAAALDRIAVLEADVAALQGTAE